MFLLQMDSKNDETKQKNAKRLKFLIAMQP